MADLEFKVTRNSNPLPAAEREEILKAPVFGANLTDHQVVCVWEKDKGWTSAEVIPYGPIMMDPSAAVLHYGQEIFEGIKAYRHQDGSIWTFRPEANAKRLQKSAHRMALPELPVEIFVESLHKLLEVDGAWVPAPVNEKTLYIRPFEIAAENFGPDDIVAQLSDYIIKTHPHGLCDMKESGALALNVSPVETRSCVSFSYQLLAGVHHFALRPRYINEGI